MSMLAARLPVPFLLRINKRGQPGFSSSCFSSFWLHNGCSCSNSYPSQRQSYSLAYIYILSSMLILYENYLPNMNLLNFIKIDEIVQLEARKQWLRPPKLLLDMGYMNPHCRPLEKLEPLTAHSSFTIIFDT